VRDIDKRVISVIDVGPIMGASGAMGAYADRRAGASSFSGHRRHRRLRWSTWAGSNATAILIPLWRSYRLISPLPKAKVGLGKHQETGLIAMRFGKRRGDEHRRSHRDSGKSKYSVGKKLGGVQQAGCRPASRGPRETAAETALGTTLRARSAHNPE
jgi:hypothetical protein